MANESLVEPAGRQPDLAIDSQLMEVTQRPGDSAGAHNSLAVLSAVGMAANAMPSATDAILSAARSGAGLRVEFPPQVMKGLRDGSLKLLTTSDGSRTATAVTSSSNHFVANGRVVGEAGGTALKGATLATAGVVMLPIAVAALASYQQQQQLERALADIQSTLNRIEERLKDTEHGVCDAAESFVAMASQAAESGPLPPYLRLELAAHRARVEAVYAARRRYVHRFKAELEQEQIAFEQRKGERQPWVDRVQELAKDGVLQEELVLFVRSLVAQSRLDTFAAMCLADEGLPEVAAKLLHDSERELRTEFFDLHNRLRPLASIAPPRGIRERVPLMARGVDQAHEVAKSLVDQLNRQVLPSIPDPDDDRALVFELNADEVRDIAALLETPAA